MGSNCCNGKNERAAGVGRGMDKLSHPDGEIVIPENEKKGGSGVTGSRRSVVPEAFVRPGVPVVRPTFMVDEAVCRRNIERMAEKSRSLGMRFRPHFKTHQSAAIGDWFRDAGVEVIAVSSVSMARYFAEAGWKDITIAFPVNIRELEEINRLADRVKLGLLVENEIVMRTLADRLTSQVEIWIEIDTGYGRSGVDTIKTRVIDQMLAILRKSDMMVFRGFLSHSGQTYAARSVEDIRIRHADALLQMRSLKNHYQPEWPGVEISMGDTPASSVCDLWEGVDEFRPGNFLFYDLMQWQLGVCDAEDIAVRVICPVVSKQIMRNEAVIYGGAVHLSKELMIGPNGKKWFGGVVWGPLPRTEEEEDESGKQEENSGKGRYWISNATWVAGLSQEHGIIRGAFEDIKALQPGDLLEIIPVHSCLAADLAGYYLTTRGEIITKMEKQPCRPEVD